MSDVRTYFIDLGKAGPWALNAALSIPALPGINNPGPRGHWVGKSKLMQDLPQDFGPYICDEAIHTAHLMDAEDRENCASLCALALAVRSSLGGSCLFHPNNQPDITATIAWWLRAMHTIGTWVLGRRYGEVIMGGITGRASLWGTRRDTLVYMAQTEPPYGSWVLATRRTVRVPAVIEHESRVIRGQIGIRDFGIDGENLARGEGIMCRAWERVMALHPVADAAGTYLMIYGLIHWYSDNLRGRSP